MLYLDWLFKSAYLTDTLNVSYSMYVSAMI